MQIMVQSIKQVETANGTFVHRTTTQIAMLMAIIIKIASLLEDIGLQVVASVCDSTLHLDREQHQSVCAT